MTRDKADQRIRITSAYFTPRDALRERMMNAARRGLDAQVLIPKYSNNALVDWIARPHTGESLDAGVRIFEYQRFVVHAKTATADGLWSAVGSANLDTLSLFGLHETNLELYSESVADGFEHVLPSRRRRKGRDARDCSGGVGTLGRFLLRSREDREARGITASRGARGRLLCPGRTGARRKPCGFAGLHS